MNLTRISNRIEIWFWTAWVAVLRSRQLGPALVQALAAVACTLVITLAAFWAWNPGRSAVHPERRGAALAAGQPAGGPAAGAAVSTERPTNGQTNLLILLVDSRSSNSLRLHGAWLLARTPVLPQVTVLPVYPSSDPAGLPFDRRLAEEFTALPDAGLPAAFVDALQAQGLWWDHYLVLDEAGLVRLADLLGGLDMGAGRLSGRKIVAALPENRDPAAVLLYQSQVLRAACARSANLPAGPAQTALAGWVANAAHSDLTSEAVNEALKSFAGSGIVCQFPTLPGR